MATNKFLPFVVENSTPKHIFKTLMQRGKGIPDRMLATILNIVLYMGIDNLRKKIKNFPELQDTVTLYERLMQEYQSLDVSSTYMDIFRALPFKPGWEEEMVHDLDEFSAKEKRIFLCVLSKHEGMSAPYVNINFDCMADYIAILKKPLKELVSLSDKGTPLSLHTMVDLQAFILYDYLLRIQIDPEEPKKVWNLHFHAIPGGSHETA